MIRLTLLREHPVRRVQGYGGGRWARELRVIVVVPKDIKPRIWLAWTSHARLIPTGSVEAEVVAVYAIVLEPGEVVVVELRERVESHRGDMVCWSGGSMGRWIVWTRR